METSTPHTLKILVVSPWATRWSLGSAAGVADDYHFIDELSRKGVELHFLVPQSKEEETLDASNVVMHTFPNFFEATAWWPTAVKWLLWTTMFYVIVSIRAVWVARRIRPDFVLGHSHYGALPAYMVRELLNIPSGLKLFGVMDLVHTEWPQRKYYLHNIEQIVALKIPQDLWIVLDDGTKGRDAALRHGVPADKLHFLPNGINLEWLDGRYDRRAYRESLQIADETMIVLFLARLVESKRPERVIEAIPRVKQGFNGNLVFLFAGDGPERERCETLVREYGVEESVRFIGVVPHATVPELMHACDLFVSTSRLTNAAIPTCEAMICGLPVVAFDVGNTSELLGDGSRGRLVSDDNVAALAGALIDLLGDTLSRGALAQAAREYAAHHFMGWPERIDIELTLIRSAIEDHAMKKARSISG